MAQLIREALKSCTDNTQALLTRDETAILAVFEGLVKGGIAMAYAGVSRPASGAYFRLMNDVGFENCLWEPVGTGKSIFNGHFDGNGHVIKNIRIQSMETNHTEVYKTASDSSKTPLCTDKINVFNGFFGRTGAESVVENLGLEGIKINFWNHDYYYNIKVKNDLLVSSSSCRAKYNGGMVGCSSGKIINCYVKDSEVRNMQRDSYDSNVSGFVRYADNTAVFENCYVINTELCASYYSAVCGFVGKAMPNAKFSNCYSAGVSENLYFASHVEKESTVYGFGMAEKGTNATDCVSELNDYQAQTANACVYDSEHSFGVVYASKEGIIKAVADYENMSPDNFDNNVNGDYSICLWQMSDKAKQNYDAQSYDMSLLLSGDLPQNIGKFNSAVRWIASDSGVINESGMVTFYTDPKSVTLYAVTADGLKTKTFNVTVEGKVPFENYSFIVKKEGEEFSESISGGVLEKVSFYKNRSHPDCYMVTGLYDESGEMLGCSVDSIKDEATDVKKIHTIELNNHLRLSENVTLKLIFIDNLTSLKPICNCYMYSE